MLSCVRWLDPSADRPRDADNLEWEYSQKFGLRCIPIVGYVGFERTLKAIEEGIPVPYSEYEEYETHASVVNSEVFKRARRADEEGIPVSIEDEEEIEKLEKRPPTWISCADTPEEEQVIKEYERMFGEKCPAMYVDCERAKKAIRTKTPIPKEEWEHAAQCDV